MNIEARKINIAQLLFTIQKEALLDKIEDLLKKEATIPQWQINETQRRLDLVDKGEMKTRSWDEAKKDIFKK